MSSHNDEEVVLKLFADRGLKAVRFTQAEMRQGTKTPDFQVFRGDDLVFYCEVKSVERDRWLDDKLDSVVPGTTVGGSRDDPTFNRLTADIHTAAKQFLSLIHI